MCLGIPTCYLICSVYSDFVRLKVCRTACGAAAVQCRVQHAGGKVRAESRIYAFVDMGVCLYVFARSFQNYACLGGTSREI